MERGSYASTAHKCAHLIAGLSDTHSAQGAGANRGHRTSVEDLAIVVALLLTLSPSPSHSQSASNERQQ